MSNEKMEVTTFEKLSAINVNDRVEKKNGLTYLSWAWAWSEVKKACPNAVYHINDTEYDDDLGFMCHTQVCIGDETLEMWLPVMDGANKSMKKRAYKYTTRYGEKSVEGATTFDINKTIMRCLVKNLAMFGLGIYIYAGEDLPEGEEAVQTVAKEIQKKPAGKLTLKSGDDNWAKVCKYVTENKAAGQKLLIDTLSSKYSISAKSQDLLIKLINTK